LYLAINLGRFFWFKDSPGGGVFGLSDRWIEEEEERKAKKDARERGRSNESK
jgi:hypothetical protein